MRAIIQRPIGRHFTSERECEFRVFFSTRAAQLEFFYSLCFGLLSVVSDWPTTTFSNDAAAITKDANRPAGQYNTQQAPAPAL